MIRSDDPIRDFDRWDTEQWLQEMKRPVCNDCGNPIMDDYMWEFHGLFYCEKCLKDHRIDIENYLNMEL